MRTTAHLPRILFLAFALLSTPTLWAQGQRNFHFDGPAILIHGGAGGITRANVSPQQAASYEASLSRVLQAGYERLSRGDSGMDVVVHCLTLLEEDSLFNAGRGAVVNDLGQAELDASVMDGRTKMAGAVAGLKHVRRPAELARRVMEQTPHVLLIGEGAETFAREQGMEMVENAYFLTARRKAQYERWKLQEKNGTVGVVVLDRHGNLYAGTSTGGMMGKKFGRVGDVPIVGAGTYADNASAAVSCTGHGEYYIRESVAFQIGARMRYEGLTLKQSAYKVLFEVLNAEHGNGGIIALDRDGHGTWTFNSTGMFRGACGVDASTGEKIEAVGIFEEEGWR